MNANPNVAVTVDAEALPVVNVSPEVYDIFDMTGFMELLDVKKRLREISVEGCELDDESEITVTAFQAKSCSMGIILDNCLFCRQIWRLIIASTL